jgi:hypothetical protein
VPLVKVKDEFRRLLPVPLADRGFGLAADAAAKTARMPSVPQATATAAAATDAGVESGTARW